MATVAYQLANNPDRQLKLQEELDRVIPDPSEPLTKQQLDDMRYKMCQESSDQLGSIYLPSTFGFLRVFAVLNGQVLILPPFLRLIGTIYRNASLVEILKWVSCNDI